MALWGNRIACVSLGLTENNQLGFRLLIMEEFGGSSIKSTVEEKDILKQSKPNISLGG